MKVLFCGYRDWALTAFDEIKEARNLAAIGAGRDLDEFTYAQNPESLITACAFGKLDVIVGVGWSWYIPADITDNNVFIGMHPSDLPRFAGGSPIQNQILAGVTETKATLFRLNAKFDAGKVIDKEPIDLSGHLDQVLASLSSATVAMVLRFLDRFPDFTEVDQGTLGEGSTVRRRKPEQSQLTRELLSTLTSQQLWDFIRCREDPYPNAFIEDETGRLTIKRVEFEPKVQP